MNKDSLMERFLKLLYECTVIPRKDCFMTMNIASIELMFSLVFEHYEKLSALFQQ